MACEIGHASKVARRREHTFRGPIATVVSARRGAGTSTQADGKAAC